MKQSRIDMIDTSPLVNFYNEALFANFQKEMMAFMRAPHDAELSCVDWVKSKLGRQDYTKVTGHEYRYWIWEREHWRLFVNNTRGMCFEVEVGLTPQQAYDQWNSFRRLLGILP